MIVIFISQCEKKALKKTRRVLDAFADRIGDNTWQTVITEEGLNTVQKMLRQTASKSTAVSCHWIRSRSRSHFLWVVGSKDKFNHQGIVPVNYTTVTDLKMDETKMMKETAYANTNKQPLDQHLFAVGYVAYQLVNKLVNNDKLAKAAFVAGCLHDIGKLDPEFQRWITGIISKRALNEMVLEDGQHIDKGNFTFDKYARHNEISLLLYQFMGTSNLTLNKQLSESIAHAIYWHHAKPIRKDEYKKLNDIYRKLNKSIKNKGIAELCQMVRQILTSVSTLNHNYDERINVDLGRLKTEFDEDLVSNFRKQDLPEYKEYDIEDSIDDYSTQILKNAKQNILRACVISADRQVSALTAEQLKSRIVNNSLADLVNTSLQLKSELTQAIAQCLSGFEQQYPNSQQNIKQRQAAQNLAEIGDVAVLNGPAGCGKTKIALEWAGLTDANKIIWICPRVQVCEGLFLDLTAKEYLPQSAIELCTGEFKQIKQNGITKDTPEHALFSGDIVLTTIDQVLNSITTHTNATAFIDYMNAHVVFDEYHEYIHMPAFNLLFAELVKCKSLRQRKAYTLLVSATPNYHFLTHLLDVDKDDIVNIASFNQSKYQIDFQTFDEEKQDENNPLFETQPPNTIVISNTATTAQQSFIKNQAFENAMVLHSKFKANDKLAIFDQVFASFKKSGNKAIDVLRSGPIVQASLNITCDKMISEYTIAENWLQRLGRLDRFSDNQGVNQYVIAVPQSLAENKGTGPCARFLSSMNCLQSAKAWFQFLQQELRPGEIVSIAGIYQLYHQFYQSSKGQTAVEQDLIAALKNSVRVINAKVHDPICFPKKKITTDKKKLKKSSLRGDSRFVQMAMCQILNDGNVRWINDYACDSAEQSFTMSVNEIEGYDPSGDKNLLGFMHQKHHKILSAKSKTSHKQAHKSFLLKDQAIDVDSPIYVSYTQEDLDLCHDQPHEHAIYYVLGEKQAIGAMSFGKFNQQNTLNNNKD